MGKQEGHTAPRILVVDDEPEIRRLLEFRLKASGFEVSMAQNGPECFQKAQAERPDLIILDLKMPGLHGKDAARKLRKNPTTQRIPIIFLTGMPEGTEDEPDPGARADAVVTKPFVASRLIDEIRRVITPPTPPGNA